MNKGGFSWKRAIGVTRAKSKISRATGIPLTKSGRQRKIGRMVTGGGCLLPMLGLWLGLAVIVAACSPAAHTTSVPTQQSPPAPTPVTRTSAEVQRILIEGIVQFSCSAPAEDWCRTLRKVGGKPDVYVDRPSVFVSLTVAATTTGKRLAKSACTSIAAMHFDDNGVDLGFTGVHVAGAGNVALADCVIPVR